MTTWNENNLLDAAQDPKEKRFDSGLFPPETRTTMSKEALDIMEAFEVASFGSRMETYETKWDGGVEYIMTPGGTLQTLTGYINQLERAAITLSRTATAHLKEYQQGSIVKYLKFRFKNYWVTKKAKAFIQDVLR